jgi:hypothetical protein
MRTGEPSRHGYRSARLDALTKVGPVLYLQRLSIGCWVGRRENDTTDRVPKIICSSAVHLTAVVTTGNADGGKVPYARDLRKEDADVSLLLSFAPRSHYRNRVSPVRSLES